MNDHDNLSQEHRDLIEKSNNRNLVMPEFKVKHFVGNAQITPYAKLKQYIIELNGREMAVESMLYENKKAQLEIELEKEKAAACQPDPVPQDPPRRTGFLWILIPSLCLLSMEILLWVLSRS